MYIITRSVPLENTNNTNYEIKAPEIEANYRSAGYQRHERRYKLKYHHRDYIIICPEYRDIANKSAPIVIIPEFLIPGRPYPVEVYLYAIDLYSSNPELGQRAAAEATRKHFGLATFSHTTLGRAMKRFVQKAEATKSVSQTEDLDNQANHHNGHKNRPVKGVFPSVHTTATLRTQAVKILSIRISQVERLEAIIFCHELAKKRFKEYRRFLL